MSEYEVRANTDARPLDIQVEDLRRQLEEVTKVVRALVEPPPDDLAAAHPAEASHLAFVERMKRRQ